MAHDVRIVAVTKTHPAAAVRAAAAAGLRDVGENRVQEALEKQEALLGACAGSVAPDRLRSNGTRHGTRSAGSR